MTSLPIINISPFLLPGSTLEDRKTTSSSIHAACQKFGFFYLKGMDSVVKAKEMEIPLATARDFFIHATSEEKERLTIRKGDGARGYQKIGANVTEYKGDYHEALDFYAPVPIETEDDEVLLHGSNQWPSDEFRSVMENWVEKMKIVGMALLEATGEGLGLDMQGEEWKELKRSVENSFWVMRAIGYPPLPVDADGISCGSHVRLQFRSTLSCSRSFSTNCQLRSFSYSVIMDYGLYYMLILQKVHYKFS